eukprot:3517337-Prymnesium_polylepis.1
MDQRRLVVGDRVEERLARARQQAVRREPHLAGERHHPLALLETAQVAISARQLVVPLVRKRWVRLDHRLHLVPPRGRLSAAVKHVRHRGHVDARGTALAREVGVRVEAGREPFGWQRLAHISGLRRKGSAKEEESSRRRRELAQAGTGGSLPTTRRPSRVSR